MYSRLGPQALTLDGEGKFVLWTQEVLLMQVWGLRPLHLIEKERWALRPQELYEYTRMGP